MKPNPVITALMGVLVVLLVATAGFLTWKAFSLSEAQAVQAPLPAQEFKQPAGSKVEGPTGKEPVELRNSEETNKAGNGKDDAKGSSGVTMTTARMKPNTLFIPALGVYLPLEADKAFVESKYKGFETIKIPKDAWHGVWYAGGAPLYGGNEGTTMVAAHVSTVNGWGALWYLHRLKGGEMIHTKDAQGRLQSWQMTSMRVEDHRDFPQEYWSAKGKRQLVVTTCGGTVNSHNYFQQNIFAIAEPVDPKA